MVEKLYKKLISKIPSYGENCATRYHYHSRSSYVLQKEIIGKVMNSNNKALFYKKKIKKDVKEEMKISKKEVIILKGR
jgi:hypothetical protein